MNSSNETIHAEGGGSAVALAPEELDPADLIAIREAVAPQEARDLDYLLD